MGQQRFSSKNAKKIEKGAEKVIQGRSESRIKEMRPCINKSTEDMGSKGNWALALHPVSSMSHREARHMCWQK